MSIDVRLNNVSLSQNRLALIENSKTLNDAQRMGLWDKLVDWCRGGVKREAIKQAFDFLHSPGNDQGATNNKPAKQENLLFHFNVLHTVLRPEHADKLRLIVQQNDDQKTWSYRMDLDGKTLVFAKDLPIGSGYTMAAFEDYAMLANFGSYLHKQYGAESTELNSALREQFSEINTRQANFPSQDPSSIQFEKFRIVCDNLEGMGVPGVGCSPCIELSQDLSSAELYVGEHLLGICQISSQAALTDTLTTLAYSATKAVDLMLEGRDSNVEILETLQDMVDDIGERKVMEGEIYDPFFCKENFVSTKVLEGDNSKFAATFRDTAGSGEEKTLIFSNRGPCNTELRAENLQGKLKDRDYSNIAELISQRLGTPQDSKIAYTLTLHRNAFSSILMNLETDGDARARLGFSDKEAVEDYFQKIKEVVIAPMKLGGMDLGAAWSLEATAHGKISWGNGDENSVDTPVDPLSTPEVTPEQQMAFLASNKA